MNEQELKIFTAAKKAAEENFEIALHGLLSGQTAKRQELITELSETRLALGMALGLSDPKRMTADTKGHLNEYIYKVIGDGCNGFEKNFIEREANNDKE